MLLIPYDTHNQSANNLISVLQINETENSKHEHNLFHGKQVVLLFHSYWNLIYKICKKNCEEFVGWQIFFWLKKLTTIFLTKDYLSYSYFIQINVDEKICSLVDLAQYWFLHEIRCIIAGALMWSPHDGMRAPSCGALMTSWGLHMKEPSWWTKMKLLMPSWGLHHLEPSWWHESSIIWRPPDVLVLPRSFPTSTSTSTRVEYCIIFVLPYTHPPSGQVVTLTETDLE